MLIKIIELNCNCGFNFNFKIKNPIHGHLFVRFTSPARVLTKKGYEEAKPGDFIFYRDVEEIAYSSGDWRFRHDYFRFYLEGDEMSLFDFPTSELYKAPISSKMDDLLKLITREFYSANENRRESLDLIGKLFLLGAKEHINAPGDTYSSKIKDEILSLRVEMISSPEKDWTVDLLAQKAHLSPSYFQGVYKKTFGVSPINDLIEARIKKAESYLLSSNKKETEIASLCGYKNVEHFIRQFRRLRSISPSDYRKRN